MSVSSCQGPNSQRKQQSGQAQAVRAFQSAPEKPRGQCMVRPGCRACTPRCAARHEMPMPLCCGLGAVEATRNRTRTGQLGIKRSFPRFRRGTTREDDQGVRPNRLLPFHYSRWCGRAHHGALETERLGGVQGTAKLRCCAPPQARS